jgi:hypothetical protein
MWPVETLAPFIDADKFDIVGKDAAPQFTVALNRCDQSNVAPNGGGGMVFLNKPWLISIRRGNLIFSAVARNGSAHTTYRQQQFRRKNANGKQTSEKRIRRLFAPSLGSIREAAGLDILISSGIAFIEFGALFRSADMGAKRQFLAYSIYF